MNKKTLVLLHGLNNPPEVLQTLATHFASKGFKIHLFNLYAHKKGQPLKEQTLKECLQHIHYQMLQIPKEEEIYFLGFSQGALVFELYQMMNLCQHKIKSQVLIAPSFYIKRQTIFGLLTKILPLNTKLFSVTPREFRQFDGLNMSYYRLLIEQLKVFHKYGMKTLSKVPTLILADAKDELIDMGRTHAEMLKNNLDNWKIVYLNRDLKHIKHYGKHHLMFNPDYFSADDWNAMMKEMEIQFSVTKHK